MPRQGLMQEDLSMVRPLGPPAGASLKAAVTASGAAEHTIVLSPGVWTCETAGGDITVPPNLTLYRTPGASLVIEAGVTVTVSRLIDAEADIVTDPPAWVSGPGTFVLTSQGVGQLRRRLLQAPPIEVANGATYGPVGPAVWYPEFATATTDLSTRLNQLIAAMPAGGGTIDCRGFRGTVNLGSTVVVNKPCHLELGRCDLIGTADPIIRLNPPAGRYGRISGEDQGTRVVATSATQTLVDAETDGHIRLERLFFDHSGVVATAGASIRLVGATATVSQHFIDDCTILAPSTGVFIKDVNGWYLRGCYILAYTQFGVHIDKQTIDPDSDGGYILATGIIGTGPSTIGVLSTNASGWKMTSSVLMGGGYCIVIDISDDLDHNDLNLVGNTFGLIAVDAILIRRSAGTGNMNHLQIVGNEFHNFAATGINFQTAAADYLGAYIISGNEFMGPAPGAVGLNILGGSHGIITGNLFSGGAASLGASFGAAAGRATFGPNHFVNFAPNLAFINSSGAVHAVPTIHPIGLSIDPPSIPAGGKASISVSITDMTADDLVVLNPPAALHEDLVLLQVHTTLGAVVVTLGNFGAEAVNDTARTWTGFWSNLVP